ncbi:MAG: hypothetical protein DHS80DRAFT_25738 [Piptocephalis tieghemiana]|nr:MAG: hypothetical protein DHS80DRAFT_25738 [Piptocephalis tieghemiana]
MDHPADSHPPLISQEIVRRENKEDARALVNLILLFITLILVLPSTILFVQKSRKHGSLRKRSVPLTLVSAFATLISAPIILLSSSGLVPCFVCLWNTYLILPVWVSSIVLRSWRVVVMAEMQGFITSVTLTSESSSKDPRFLSNIPKSIWRPRLCNGQSALEELSRRRRRFSNRTLLFLLAAIFAFFFALLIPIQATIDSPSYFLTSPPRPCPVGRWFYYPVYASLLIVCLIIVPYLLYRLSSMGKDGLGMRTELAINIFTFSLFYLLFIILALLVTPPFVLYSLAPLQLVLLAQIIAHTTSITFPALRCWIRDRQALCSKNQYGTEGSWDVGEGTMGWGPTDTKDPLPGSKSYGSRFAPPRSSFTPSPLSSLEVGKQKSKEAFYLALAHAPTFERMERIAAANFAAENTFFLRKLWELEAGCSRNGSEHMEARILVQELYQNFLHPSASLEVNVSRKVRSSVEQQILMGQYGPHIFAEVKEEVENLLYVNIFLKLSLRDLGIREAQESV